MKNVLTAVLCIVTVCSAAAENEPLGYGAGLCSFDGDFGIQARKDFILGEKRKSIIALQGSLFTQPRTTFRFDIDYHHVLTPDSSFRFYPLAGIDFAIQSKNNRGGFNLGGGMDFDLIDQYTAFIEAKYLFGDWDGFGLAAGIRF